MKKCRLCSKSAVWHITEIRDNEAKAIHLCEGCGQEYLNDSTSFDPESPGPVEHLGVLSEGDDLEAMAGIVCENCGVSFNEFRARGRLGCPQCYTSFGDELLQLLENIHGDTVHTGKFARSGSESSRRHYELIKLRQELKRSVASEDYETAARLRDEIQALETKLSEETS